MEINNLLYNEVFLTVLFVLIIFILYHNRKYKNKNLPPGPWNLPLIGYLPWVGKYPHLTFTNLAKKYGNIFQIKFGMQRVVILSGYETVREALTGSSALAVADRPEIFINRFFIGKGLILEKYGEAFKIRRKILIRALVLFANRENQDFHQLLENVAKNLVESISQSDGEPYYPKDDINHAVGKVISSLCYGSDFLKYENEYHIMMTRVRDFAEFTRPGNILNVFPWMEIFFYYKISHFKKLVQNFHNVSLKLMKGHRDKNSDGPPSDVAQAIIKAIEEMKNDGKDVEHFTDDDLATMAREILGAGFATVSTTLQWALLFLTLNQDIQKKVQLEIDNTVGTSRIPTLADRPNLPFTEATLLEVQRLASITPFGVPRMANENFTLGSYFIPKGTSILPNLWSAHRDPIIWVEPETFNPNRFLNSEGNEILSAVAEKIMPFGAGRRRCAGEIFARIELFVMFSTLMQQCEFKPVPEKEIDLNKYSIGLALFPDPFYLSIKRRK